MEENKQPTNPDQTAAPAPAASAPADASQQAGNPAPAPAAAPSGGMGGKTGMIIAIVVLLLLVLGGLWWWMMYGQPTNTTPTDTTPTGNSGSQNSGTDTTNNTTTNNNTTTATKDIDAVATVKSGDTRATVTAKAGKLSAVCVNGALLEGMQEQVCTYVDGTKTVKVTYGDDKVIEVTKLGF
jgi:cytoskeletal protein RodZ